MDDLRVILDRLEPELGRLEGEPEVLSGGITNRNLRVTLGESDYVLRLCGKDTEVLSIDRETEVAATRAASAAGVAPEVVRWLPELQVLVTAFVPGRPMEAAELRDPATLAVVTAALRRIHEGRSWRPRSRRSRSRAGMPTSRWPAGERCRGRTMRSRSSCPSGSAPR